MKAFNTARRLLVMLCLCGSIQAQDSSVDVDPTSEPAETVSAILIDADNDFVPDRLGQRVTVRGVITSDPLQIDHDAALSNLQDDSGGILIYSEIPELILDRISAGDRVRITGTVGQYQGMEQITAEAVSVEGEDEIPAPRIVTTRDLNGEEYTGQLVTIRGRVEVIEPYEGSNVRAVLRDDFGTVNLYVPGRFYDDPKFVNDLLHIPRVQITGIVSQTDLEPPFDSGYRLIPRSTTDVSFFPDPPYRSILIAASVTVLLLASLILWKSRRLAEKSARELKRLTQDLQRSEHQLRENQNRLRLLTQQVPAIVWSVDKSLRFTSSSGAGLKSLNLSQDEVVGQNLFEFFQTDDVKQPAIVAHRCAIGGKSTAFETMWSGRAYECHIEPLREPSGEIVGAIGLALDITARRQAEKDLQDQSDALRHSQKMEAIGRLAGGVAHDFNNLVTVIRGYCDLVAMKLDRNHELRDWFSEIKDSADRAADLTTQLLAFSRKQVLEPRVCDLNEVLANTEKLLRRIIGEHIELITDFATDLGPVQIDKSQIEQVVMNLAVNAYDAMPQGGKVWLKTVNHTVEENEPAKNRQMPEGRYAMISFRDQGEGMTEEVKSRIFEPFFTTKEVGKGTGLGLSTVYGIIIQSGGFVEVESKKGRGTTFRIYFPVAEAPRTQPASRDPHTAHTTGSETILVAEDEPAVRSLITRTLSDKGYHVIEAENGVEALDISRTAPDQIDCLITDVVMPKMSGFTLAEEAQKICPGLKVMYVSGYAYTGNSEGGKISPETFLAKPFSPEMLALKVRRLLNTKKQQHAVGHHS